jgi:trigger factor
VPGFEDSLLGLEAGQQKTFEITFPKDYSDPSLRGQTVNFFVKIHKVQKVDLPKIDDKFAQAVGPFKKLDELEADIKKQLIHQKEHDNNRIITDEVVSQIVAESKLDLPRGLVQKQKEELWGEYEANAKSAGLSLDQYLEAQNQTRGVIESELEAEARKRVKTALVLSEVANQEKVNVSQEELESRAQLLKGQYHNTSVRSELDSASSRRRIADQLLIEKTVDRLMHYVTGQHWHS